MRGMDVVAYSKAYYSAVIVEGTSGLKQYILDYLGNTGLVDTLWQTVYHRTQNGQRLFPTAQLLTELQELRGATSAARMRLLYIGDLTIWFGEDVTTLFQVE